VRGRPLRAARLTSTSRSVRRGRPWRIDEIRESSLLICCGGRGRTQNSNISVSVEVEVEGRAERRAAAFLLCCWLPASPAASFVCVFPKSFPWLELSGLVSSSGCSILLYVHVYVRGRVGGRLSLLPEDAKILGSGGDVFLECMCMV